MNSEEWYDTGTKTTFHFDDNGMFVDSNGKGPQKGFKNNGKFSDWLHNLVVNRIKKLGLIEKCHPENGAPIYHTSNAFNSPEKLLVIIQGTGRVRAGVWSVGVCAYSGINAGSVLPDIIEAQKRGMEVIVLNPNDPRSDIFMTRYRTNLGMIRHTLAVFEDLIIPSDPKRVFILCHSLSGECTIAMIRRFHMWVIPHIKAVAMTDAYESPPIVEGVKMTSWSKQHFHNWICSDKEINSPLPEGTASIHFSAGTKDHSLSTAKARPFIWPFFDENGADKETDELDKFEDYIGDDIYINPIFHYIPYCNIA
ncbi:hypothetical protein TVAG_402370 [Trichomonas vaginalis G3]|uniref:Arb2 domain-containing protein n=1 Tax=Trichomonas vaginalis (strain ATCC PRA-98 / G3) TaxID=412133 RepID=A2DHZ3_TRIV3|nr:FAM172 family protein-like protein CG10038 family [Trichomonas vaginalis G3]EAY19982.1 hypothetical protein TVAG_402370 [Trichomonas vaginalis G3]KAI5525932.1 FAM172 family protein-like protein CG10038 family [Trichomonas vaginalis G3]|eukprot:XP_001580968.1 hypothetical protein [Trichomonas vaginalis G3]